MLSLNIAAFLKLGSGGQSKTSPCSIRSTALPVEEITLSFEGGTLSISIKLIRTLESSPLVRQLKDSLKGSNSASGALSSFALIVQEYTSPLISSLPRKARSSRKGKMNP